LESGQTPPRSDRPVSLGLRSNLNQFLLLGLINVFVGGMVGLERTVLPLLGQQGFGLASKAAALSFILSFGFSKAVANFFAGRISDAIGRRRLLQLGWLIGLPVPFMVIFAPNWSWVVLANVLLGVNQAFAWSMTVNMKVDLVGPARRGLALGFNEFAGYLGVSLATVASGYVAARYGLRPQPFYLGVAFAAIALTLVLFTRDTRVFQLAEAKRVKEAGGSIAPVRSVSLGEAFKITTWQNKALSSASLAGLITNSKDGMAWGLFPLFFKAAGLSISQIGIIVALYPGTWAVFQLITGPLSDRIGRKWLIASGMATQSVGIFWILLTHGFVYWQIGAVILGIGTAMVYPTLQAVCVDVAHPDWRASSLGVYRFWRDAGYAVGALIAGILSDLLNIPMAIGVVGILPALAALVVMFRMYETLPARRT
jgi:MFS family permease